MMDLIEYAAFENIALRAKVQELRDALDHANEQCALWRENYEMARAILESTADSRPPAKDEKHPVTLVRTTGESMPVWLPQADGADSAED